MEALICLYVYYSFVFVRSPEEEKQTEQKKVAKAEHQEWKHLSEQAKKFAARLRGEKKKETAGQKEQQGKVRILL